MHISRVMSVARCFVYHLDNYNKKTLINSAHTVQDSYGQANRGIAVGRAIDHCTDSSRVLVLSLVLTQ